MRKPQIDNNEESERTRSQEGASKIARIVEVCNVSVDEAARVLNACCNDETRAIDRILSGGEDASKWSEVSKKKSRSSATRTSSTPRNNRGNSRHARDVQRRVRDRDRNSEHPAKRNGLTSSGNSSSTSQTGKVSHSELLKSETRDNCHEIRAVPVIDLRSPILADSSTHCEYDGSSDLLSGTQAKNCTRDGFSQSVSNEYHQIDSEHTCKRAPYSSVQQSSPNMRINYAAAVVSGSLQSKYPQISTSSTSETHENVDLAEAKLIDCVEPNSVKEHLSSKNSSTSKSSVCRDILPQDNFQIGDLKVHPTAPNSTNQVTECDSPTPIEQSDSWPAQSSLPDPLDPDRRETDNVDVKSVSPLGNSNCNSLVLQFGSFGITSYKSLKWTEVDAPVNAMAELSVKKDGADSISPTPGANPQRVSHSRANSVQQSHAAEIRSNSDVLTTNDDSKRTEDLIHPEQPALHDSSSSIPQSSAVAVNNLQPSIPVGVTGSFHQQSYPTSYVVPPQISYGSGVNSVDVGSDMNRMRNSTPNCLPVYEQNTVGVCPIVNSGKKQSLLPGSNDGSSQSASGVSTGNDDGLKRSTVENDSTSNQLNGALPSVDALNPPYLVTGYPYMMPSYPSMQYAPPALPPPGPGHYPFAALGVSSQSAYPAYHTQTSSVNKLASNGTSGRVFGYDEGSQLVTGVLRGGTGLNDGSVYQSGFVNATTEALRAKGISEAPVLANRASAGSSVSVALNNSMVPPLPPHQPTAESGNGLSNYDYPLNSQSHSSITNGNPTGSWSTRANGLPRSDVSSGAHSVGGSLHHGNALNSPLYPAAPPGYWAAHNYY